MGMNGLIQKAIRIPNTEYYSGNECLVKFSTMDDLSIEINGLCVTEKVYPWNKYLILR